MPNNSFFYFMLMVVVIFLILYYTGVISEQGLMNVKTVIYGSMNYMFNWVRALIGN